MTTWKERKDTPTIAPTFASIPPSSQQGSQGQPDYSSALFQDSQDPEYLPDGLIEYIPPSTKRHKVWYPHDHMGTTQKDTIQC
ncbi:hypothetical protein L484_004438 [Morus notabilis]|uniref:Uncharacterized protein n=1 Tax=Morus notabilis TaxID=981085 RepID=W9SLS5_9ROSA|nr:hypothetical protein L484_004438 [Morus notabilis]